MPDGSIAVVRLALALVSVFCFTVTTACASTVQNNETANGFFDCGGTLEKEIWRAWDDGGVAYAKDSLLDKRLVAVGDTYALYDFQALFHNLLAMAQRCNRSERQLALLQLVSAAYSQLSSDPDKYFGRAWVCRGGAVCNSTNRLVNTEVMLVSAQFLGLAASLANGVYGKGKTESEKLFPELTVSVLTEHLVRWGSLPDRMALRRRIAAKPADVTNGSSELFFTDKPVWQLAIYADLAGLLVKQPKLLAEFKANKPQLADLSENLNLLLRFFRARTSKRSVVESHQGGKLIVADVDVGYWRHYADNRFAGYTGADKPVVCKPISDREGKRQATQQIDPVTIAPVQDIGWDLSHARRLVHLFDALKRNHSALSEVFGLAADDIPADNTRQAFAHQLRIKVWNQDKDFPLFSNYFSGNNGWYRVAYDNGTGRCVEGYPPFGLTDAFPAGGFVTWGDADPILQNLGEKIYALSKSSADADRSFINTNYPALGANAKASTRMATELMFWPTLIRP